MSGDEEDRSQRRTIIASAVMEVPDEASMSSSRSNVWIFVVLGLVVVGTLYLAFR